VRARTDSTEENCTHTSSESPYRGGEVWSSYNGDICRSPRRNLTLKTLQESQCRVQQFFREGRGFHFSGHRRSISVKICSAQMTTSANAQMVAGTFGPDGYCASFRAARMEEAISSARLRPSSTCHLITFAISSPLTANVKSIQDR
jgi:hypothetical protein